MTPGEANNPAEDRNEEGARVGRAWAATAPLDEKRQFEEMVPDPNVEHDARRAHIAHTLQERALDPENQDRWPTLSPVLQGRGLTKTTSDTDAWLTGFVDGVLDVMGLNAEA